MSQTRVAGALCVLILVAFTIAGLRPFGQIRNDVSWIADRPGVLFGKHGIILSDGALQASGSGACSIEMWVRPTDVEDTSTLLAFYGPRGGTGLSLHRYMTDLRLDREKSSGGPIKAYVHDVFHDRESVFLTIVSDAHGTVVYRNGVLIRNVSYLRSTPGGCSGNFGVGHSSRGHDSWRGELRGMAIYRHELTAEQAMANYRSWRMLGRPDEHISGDPDAVYLFKENSGRVVHDSRASGVSLTIPDRYQNIQRTWLASPFRASGSVWGYVQDVLINIGGFVPFGFMLSAFLTSIKRVRRVGTWTVIGGLFVSLTIEILQVYLPTRDSDLTDVLTNTLGTCLGAAVYLSWRRRLLIQADPPKSVNSWNLD